MKIMHHFGILVLLASCAAGCTLPIANGTDQISELHRRFPIRVEPQVASLVLSVNEAGDVRAADAERIRSFAEQWKQRGYGSIGLSAQGPAGADRAVETVRDVLAGAGVGAQSIALAAPPAAAGSGAATVSVTFMTDAAVADSCDGLWEENIGEAPRNMPIPAFACSTQRNLAALVEDPRDLLEPRRQDPADAMRRGIVLDKYRKGETTATQTDQSQDGGAVSDVAKE